MSLLRSLSPVLVLVACAPEPARTAAPSPVHASQEAAAPEERPADSENDARWHATLRAIAAGYTTWGKVDDQMRWAPTLCAMPTPARARISASGDESTHGRKLYTLYAKDPEAYGAHRSYMPAPEVEGLADIAQVVVKEAFRPVEDPSSSRGIGLGGELLPAEHEGKRYVPGEPLGIYVVFQPKQAATAIDTDAGWVYGTVAADLKTVTSAGKVASCMGCHQKVAQGRLFGLAERQVMPPGPGPDGKHHAPNAAPNDRR